MRIFNNITSISIKKKFIVASIAMSVIPVILMVVIGFQTTSSEIEKKVFSNLVSVRDIKAHQIESYFKKMKNDITVLGRITEVKTAFDDIKAYHDYMKTLPNGSYDISTDRYKAVWNKTTIFFEKYLKTFEYEDIKIVCAAHGHIMYTYKKQSDLGTNLRYGKYKNSHLAKIWKRVKDTEQIQIQDFDFYEPNNNKPTAFIGVPFYKDGNLLGVVILQIPISGIDEIMQESTGMGKTGQTILVGKDRFYRSNSRLYSEPTILKSKDNSSAIAKAFEGKAGTAEYYNEDDVDVFGAYTKINIPGLDWALIYTVHFDEAMAVKAQIVQSATIMVVILSLIMSFIGIFVANYFTKPLLQIVNLFKKITKGDLTETINIQTGDEFTTLSDSISEFIKSFSMIISNLKKTEETLFTSSKQLLIVSSSVTSGITEVSDEISRVASATEQMSSNISNMSATAEEMNINANNVATSSNHMSETTSSVAAAVEEMSMSISDVLKNSNESTSIANEAANMSGNATSTMKALGIAANEIGKVTEVIKRIAEQTNLLALNATIEAASAGEAGKGFAVVANEIKELANQSSTAAEDIATKITSVQENTTNAIVVIDNVSSIIERLNKSSEIIRNSVEQQRDAVNSIATVTSEAQSATENITTNIAEVAQGSSDLAKNASESSEGANEVSQSIQNINGTAGNISATTEEFNSSAIELANIAEDLKTIIEQFKI